MRAGPVRSRENPPVQVVPATARVQPLDSGGMVGEWHRAIERRYAPPDQAQARGESPLRAVSLVGGWSALSAAYLLIVFVAFG